MNDGEDTFFVVHIPKTAGTAFYFYMRQNIPAARIYPGVADPPETRLELAALRSLPPARRARLRAYLGHFPAFAAELVGATRTATLLRDPVGRVISMLKMRQRPANPPTGNVLARTPHMTLEEIYADPDMWPWLDNVQTRLFAMQPADRPASFLDPVTLDRSRLDLAKERLAAIEVVGVQEDWLGMVRAAQKAFGWNPVSGHPRAFVSDDVPVPDGLRERIAEDMRWDRELYDFAVERIERRRGAPADGRVQLRLATLDDAPALAANVAEAFEGYKAFAPPGWEPPPAERELIYIRDRLADRGTVCVVAEVDGEVAGHVGFFDAALARRPERERGLAHFWQLFVRPRHQGTGVAKALMDAAVDGARERGFFTMRLFTPALQARARRFYEREGWRQSSEPEPHPDMGLDIVEYRLTVPRADPGGAA